MNENLGQGKDLVNGNGENVLNILVIKQNETNNCETTRNKEHCQSVWPSTCSNLSTTNANNAPVSDSGSKCNKQRMPLYKSQSFTVVEAKDAAARKRKMTCILNEADQTKHKQHGPSLARQIHYSTEVYQKHNIHSSSLTSPLHTPQGGLCHLVKSVSLPAKPPVLNRLKFSASPVLISSNLRNSSIQSLMGSPTSIQSNKMVANAGTVQNHQMSPSDSVTNHQMSAFWVLNDCPGPGVSNASNQSLLRSPLCRENVKASPDSGFCTPSQDVPGSPSSSTPLRPQNHFQDIIKPKLLSSCFSTDHLLSDHQDDSMSSELCIVDQSEDSTDSVASVLYRFNPQAEGQATSCNERVPRVEDCHSAEQQQSVGALMCHVSSSNIVVGSDGQLKTAASNYQGSKVLTEAQEKLFERPIYSYMDLIKMALSDSEFGEMTLKEILKWIEDHFPYFKIRAKKSWKSSIRHNLSLHPDFIKVEDKKHAGKWKVVTDAKKYRAKLPKPQVVKSPEQTQFFKRSRREGPQPILPKSVPFALVPLPYSFGQPMAEQIGQAVSLQLGRSIDEQLRQVSNQQLSVDIHQQLGHTSRKHAEPSTGLGKCLTRQIVPRVHHQLQQPFSTHLGLFPAGGQQIILPAQSLNVANFLQLQFEQLTSSNVKIQSMNQSFQGKQNQPIVLFPNQVLGNQQSSFDPKQDNTSNQSPCQYSLQGSLHHAAKDEPMNIAKATCDHNQASHIIRNQSVNHVLPQAQGGSLEPVTIQVMNGDNENEKKIVFLLAPKLARPDAPQTSSSHLSGVGQQSSHPNILGTGCTNNAVTQISDVNTSSRSNTIKGRKTPVKKRAGKANRKGNNSVEAGVVNETSQKPYFCQHAQRKPRAPALSLEASLQEPRVASDAELSDTFHDDVIETDCEISSQPVAEQAAGEISSQPLAEPVGERDSVPQHGIIRQAWAQVYSKWSQEKSSNFSEDQGGDIDSTESQQIINKSIRSGYMAGTSTTNSNLTDHSQNCFSQKGTVSGTSSHDVSTAQSKAVSRKMQGCSRKLLILQNHPKLRPKETTERNADKENSFAEKITGRRLEQKKLARLSLDNVVNNFSGFQPSRRGTSKSLAHVGDKLGYIEERVPAVSYPLSDRLDLLMSSKNNVINKADPSVASNSSQIPNSSQIQIPNSSSQLRCSGPSRRKQVIIPLTTEISPRRMLQSPPGDKGRRTSTPTLQSVCADGSPRSASPRDASCGDTFFQDNGHFYPSHSSMFHGSPNTSHSYLSSSPPNMGQHNLNISLSPPHTLSHFLSLTMTPPPGGQSVSLTSTPKRCQENTSFLDASLLDMSLLDNLESLMQNTSWTQLKTP